MNRSLYGIKTKLATLSKEDQKDLLGVFPEEEIAALEKIPPMDLTKPKENFLHFVHPSWIEELSLNYSKSDLRFFLPILKEYQQQVFESTDAALTLTPISSKFISQMLNHHFFKKLDPIAIASNESFSEILFLPEEIIKRIPLYLGSFDLKLELPLIINGAQLKAIYAFLPKSLSEFLRLISPSKMNFKRLGITSWNGQAHSLIESLEMRGYEKLGKIFGSHSKSFQNYLLYRFDRSKASELEQQFLTGIKDVERVHLENDLKTSIEYLSNHEV